jgi:threonine aldolase
LADELSQVRGFGIDRDAVQTNIVIIDIEKTGKMPDDALSLLRGRGVLLSAGSYSGLRAVTHLDVSMDEVMSAARTIRELFG